MSPCSSCPFITWHVDPELSTKIPGVGSLGFFKAEDVQCFTKILKEEDETELTVEEMKERKITRLLKIKNSTTRFASLASNFSVGTESHLKLKGSRILGRIVPYYRLIYDFEANHGCIRTEMSGCESDLFSMKFSLLPWSEHSKTRSATY